MFSYGKKELFVCTVFFNEDGVRDLFGIIWNWH